MFAVNHDFTEFHVIMHNDRTVAGFCDVRPVATEYVSLDFYTKDMKFYGSRMVRKDNAGLGCKEVFLADTFMSIGEE